MKPQQEPKRTKLGGWKHPLALVLLLVAIGWVVATVFATTDNDFPRVGEVPLLFGIGKWNYGIAAVFGLAAMSVADRTRPVRPPDEPDSLVTRWAGPAMATSAILGLVWIVPYYVFAGTSVTIPFYSGLGGWNIVIGMGFILASFGFAMKWK